MTDQTKEPGVTLAQVYLESVEFSHRADALSLPANTKPEIGTLDVALEIAVSADERTGYIRLTASTSADTQPVYNVKLTMIGLASASPEPNMSIRDFLIGSGISMIYPFVREALANITQRGRFGPIWLNPINAVKLAEQLREGLAQQPVSSGLTPGAVPPGRTPRRPSAQAQARALRGHRKK